MSAIFGKLRDDGPLCATTMLECEVCGGRVGRDGIVFIVEGDRDDRCIIVGEGCAEIVGLVLERKDLAYVPVNIPTYFAMLISNADVTLEEIEIEIETKTVMEEGIRVVASAD